MWYNVRYDQDVSVACILRIIPSGARTEIFRYDMVNAMVADDLAPCVFRSSAAMLLNMQDEVVLALKCQRDTFAISVKYMYHVSKWNWVEL